MKMSFSWFSGEHLLQKSLIECSLTFANDGFLGIDSNKHEALLLY